MKRLIFLFFMLISLIEIADAQGSRFVGAWLAVDKNMSYKITITLDTVVQDGDTLKALTGDIIYLRKGKITRHIKKDLIKPQFYTVLSSAKYPMSYKVNNKAIFLYNDFERYSETWIDLIISDDNNSFQWVYNEMASHEELIEKIRKRSQGEKENQPTDIPKKLTFKRISK
jgi:hypothetical protein